MVSADTKIEWTHPPGFRGATWNPTRGCRKISAGCKHCYAATFAERWRGVPGHAYEQGFDPRTAPDKLDMPLRTKAPTCWFVNSMSDLFLEDFSDEYIDQVFAVMLLAPRHRFLVLTKRAERMRRYFADASLYERVLRAANIIRQDRPEGLMVGISNPATFPARWIWLGVSVENQATADERIPHILATPAAVRFVSYEPALGPVDFGNHLILGRWDSVGRELPKRGIDWLIIGGESGPGARPFDVAWARSAIEQCKAAGVACFVKQFGARPIDGVLGHDESGRWEPAKNWLRGVRNRKGSETSEWPADLRVREWPTT